MSRRTDLQRLIELNSRYLQKLKEQKAVKGIDAEPALLIEIEDKEAELAQLQAELEALEAEPETLSKRLNSLSCWQMGLIGVVGVGLVCGAGLVGWTLIYLSNLPAVPQDTPTPLLALPPTPTPPPLLPTPTLTPAAPSSLPTSSVAVSEGLTVPCTPECPDLGAQICQPGHGDRVNGIIQISGAASIDNFDYYKFEFRPPNGEWTFIQRYDKQVINDGVLGSWNTATVPPGEYEFRLVVVDEMGYYLEPCVIRLIVE